MNPWSPAQIYASENAPGFVGPPRPMTQDPLAMNNQQYMSSGLPLAPNLFKKSTEQDSKTNQQQSVLKDLFMTPEEYQARVQAAMEQPEVKAQTQGIDRLEQMNRAQAAHMPVNFDYSPLQRLANYVTGTHTPDPNIRQADWGKVTGFADEIQKRRADIIKSVKEGIQSQRAGKATDLLSYLMTQKMANEIGTKPITTTPEMKFNKDWEAYSKDNREGLARAQEAYDTLHSGSLTGLQAFKLFMATASARGRVTNKELSAFGGPPDVQSRIDRAWEKFTTGKMTDRDQADMDLLAGAYMNYRRRALDLDSAHFTKEIGPKVYGIDPSRAQSIVKPSTGFGDPNVPPAPPPKEKSIAEQFLEFQKAKAAK